MSETADNRVHEDAHEAYTEDDENMGDELRDKLDETADIEDPMEQQAAADALSDEE